MPENILICIQCQLECFLGIPWNLDFLQPLSDISISDTDSEYSRGLRFHRSVSMGTNGTPWFKSGYDGRIVMMRRRNNSSCEFPAGNYLCINLYIFSR